MHPDFALGFGWGLLFLNGWLFKGLVEPGAIETVLG